MAVDVLKSRGVPEDRILFLNLIASPEGVTSFAKRFPELRVVTAFVDQGLDAKKYETVPLRPMFTNRDLAILSQDLATSVTASIHSECKVYCSSTGFERDAGVFRWKWCRACVRSQI